MIITQSDRIRDYVFPLASTNVQENGELSLRQFIGSGFMIGNKGYAVTAVIFKGKSKHPSTLWLCLCLNPNGGAFQ